MCSVTFKQEHLTFRTAKLGKPSIEAPMVQKVLADEDD
jgi:hypothetical protein